MERVSGGRGGKCGKGQRREGEGSEGVGQGLKMSIFPCLKREVARGRGSQQTDRQLPHLVDGAEVITHVHLANARGGIDSGRLAVAADRIGGLTVDGQAGTCEGWVGCVNKRCGGEKCGRKMCGRREVCFN